MKKIVQWVLIWGVFALLAAGCGGVADNGLEATVSALETQLANQEEWISYQATQVGSQQQALEYLATLVPREDTAGAVTVTPTAYVSDDLTGSVVIHGGSCCIGGTAGEPIMVDVQFEASSAGGEVVEMRVITAQAEVSADAFEQRAWNPFTAEVEYQIYVPTNWTSFWVFVQYRDSRGLVSEIYSDEIAVEGMPVTPTP